MVRHSSMKVSTTSPYIIQLIGFMYYRFWGPNICLLVMIILYSKARVQKKLSKGQISEHLSLQIRAFNTSHKHWLFNFSITHFSRWMHNHQICDLSIQHESKVVVFYRLCSSLFFICEHIYILIRLNSQNEYTGIRKIHKINTLG